MRRLRRPPKLAVWLIRTLDCGRFTEEMLGDIQEQYTSTKSRIWYWREIAGVLYSHRNFVISKSHLKRFAGWMLIWMMILSLVKFS